MHRQTALSLAATGLVVVLLAGCSAPGASSGPGATAPSVMVQPGDSGTLVVEARHVTSLRLGFVGTDGVSLDWGNDTVRPAPDATYQSLPPVWTWQEGVDSVTVAVPYAVAENATAGTRGYEVVATADSTAANESVDATGAFVVEASA